MKYTERQIKAFKYLGMTDEEIKQAEEYDTLIDKGGRPEYLGTIEEEKEANKNSKLVVARKPRATGAKREKKADENKLAVINAIAKALESEYGSVNIANAETQIDFSIGEESYSIKLTKHRAAKA